MDTDRRMLLLGSLLLAAGCAGASDSTATPRSGGKRRVNPAVPTAMDAQAAAGWRVFKTAYLQSDGRVVDTGNGGISHSEGQGYGMLLAEQAGDREAFESLSGWTERVLGRTDVALHSWRYVPTAAKPVGDPNNATDGDILIAWALMRAHARWGRAADEARAQAIRSAIRTRLIHRQDDWALLLPALDGFVGAKRTTVNPSYYIWPALERFRDADGAAWSALITDGERLAATARFGASRLPCDWVDVTAAGVAPAADKPPRFGFDAIRVPLYQVMGGRRRLTEDVAAYWRDFARRQADIPAWVDVTTGEHAPYALSEGGMAVVRRLLEAGVPAPPPATQRDYYSDVLAQLAQSQFRKGSPVRRS